MSAGHDAHGGHDDGPKLSGGGGGNTMSNVGFGIGTIALGAGVGYVVASVLGGMLGIGGN